MEPRPGFDPKAVLMGFVVHKVTFVPVVVLIGRLVSGYSR